MATQMAEFQNKSEQVDLLLGMIRKRLLDIRRFLQACREDAQLIPHMPLWRMCFKIPHARQDTLSSTCAVCTATRLSASHFSTIALMRGA